MIDSQVLLKHEPHSLTVALVQVLTMKSVYDTTQAETADNHMVKARAFDQK